MKIGMLLGAAAALVITGTVSAQVEIPAMTVAHSWIDMDLVGPQGPTTVAAINAGGNNGGGNIVNITLTTPTSVPGQYGFQPGRGRGLAGDPSGSLGLYLVDNTNQAFGSMDQMIIDLGMVSTEFGFSIGDWSGPINANLFLGAAPVGTIAMDFTGSPNPHFLQLAGGFDRVVITANPQFSGANWVVPDLYVQIPGPGSLALLAVAGLAGGRRRRR